MATKAKKKAAPKKGKAAAKKSPKKPAAKKAAPKKPAPPKRSKPKGPFVVVRNHRFAPGVEVGFYPAHTVEVERSLGREPMSAPTATAKVKARGLLEVGGLPKGRYCAVGPVGDRWAYLTFPVN